MPKVLTLGGNAGSALLAIVRSLGRKGIEVHSAWHRPSPTLDRSRYLARTWELPPYDPRDHGWKSALIELMRTEQFDLVIPCDDPALLPLQAHREDFRATGRVYLLEDGAFEVAFSKRKTHDLALELGIPVPRQERVEDSSDLAAAAERLGLPVVVKPDRTFRLDDLRRRRDVRKAYSLDELHQYVSDLAGSGAVLLEENFLGAGAGLGVLAHGGELLVAFQYVRVHEPIAGGGSSYRRSVTLDPQLEDAARKILHALGYTGVMMIELKLDLDRGQWILVELNGRFWGALALAVNAGADFPSYLYQLLVEGQMDFPRSYRAGLYARNWSNDLRWLRANLRADRSDPTLMTRSLWEVAAESWNVARLRERSDSFAIDDVSPAVGELCELAGTAARRAVRRTIAAVEAIPPLPEIRRRRLLSAAETARRFLFVCNGNISRSAFAEAYARSKAPAYVELASAGCLPLEARPSPAAAIAAGADHDVELSEHRSQMLTHDLTEWADIVLIFDEAQREAIAREFPFAGSKVHYIGAADASASPQIADPHGRDPEFFRLTFSRIRAALDRLAAQVWVSESASATPADASTQ